MWGMKRGSTNSLFLEIVAQTHNMQRKATFDSFSIVIVAAAGNPTPWSNYRVVVEGSEGRQIGTGGFESAGLGDVGRRGS
jgi:hypothetical protein